MLQTGPKLLVVVNAGNLGDRLCRTKCRTIKSGDGFAKIVLMLKYTVEFSLP